MTITSKLWLVDRVAHTVVRVRSVCLETNDITAAADSLAARMFDLACEIAVHEDAPDQPRTCAVAIDGIRVPRFGEEFDDPPPVVAVHPAVGVETLDDENDGRPRDAKKPACAAPEHSSDAAEALALASRPDAASPGETSSPTPDPTAPPRLAKPMPAEWVWSHRLQLAKLDTRRVALAIRIANFRPTEETDAILQIVVRHAAEAMLDGPLPIAARRRCMLEAIGPAQRRLVPYLLTDRTERDIAQAVHRSRHTVHDHVKLIYAAWNVASRAELADAWSGRRSVPLHLAGVSFKSLLSRTPTPRGTAERPADPPADA